MYAIIESGGKQHKVFEGDVLRLEKLEAVAGETVNFSNVLLVASEDQVTIGAPYVENIQVTGEVLEQGRGDKVRIIKFKRRKHHQKATGHRQYFTEVKITGIQTGAAPKAKKVAEVAEEQPAAEAAAKKPAAKKAAAKPAAKKAAPKAKSTASKKAAADKTEE